MRKRDFLKYLSAGALLPSASLMQSCEPKGDNTTDSQSDTAKKDTTQDAYLESEESKAKKVETSEAKPTAAQQAWMDLGFGLFLHFGINTYYDVEWSDGNLDPSKYNPTELDTDQWCEVAKAAGMKYVVITAKHHDGFCNWPSDYTDYDVSSTPFKKDVIAELANSCEKHGLKLGIYYSLWDRHEETHDKDEPAYVAFMLNQLEELCTRYGTIVELWLDGFWKKQHHGWGSDEQRPSGEDFIKAWRFEGAYRWQMDRLYQQVKQWQPECLILNNPTTAFRGVPLHPVDARSGEKATETAEDQKVWNWLGNDIYLPLQIETTLSVKGNKRFKSGNWFWHEWDHSVASKETIQKYLATAKKFEANLLLNSGIMDSGKMRPEDVEVLKSLNA